jgi:zinc transporter
MDYNQSPNDGLVAAYRLNGEGGGETLDWKQLEAGGVHDESLWIHLDYSCTETRHWLEEHSGLDAFAIDALLAEETRPRCTLIQGNLLLILRGVNMNPGSNPEDMVSIRIWSDGRRIISTRKRQLLSVSELRSDIESGNGPKTAAELITSLADKLVSRMSSVIAQIDDDIDDLEQQVLSLQSHQLRPLVSTLRRETISLRRYLAPQRDALSRLVSERLEWMDVASRVELREIADRTIRYVEELDAARERAIVVQEELMGRLSEQMDKRMYVLSIVAALFLPLGFLTGLLGINVGGIPGTDNSHAFAYVSIGLIGILALQFALFRWRKWF